MARLKELLEQRRKDLAKLMRKTAKPASGAAAAGAGAAAAEAVVDDGACDRAVLFPFTPPLLDYCSPHIVVLSPPTDRAVLSRRVGGAGTVDVGEDGTVASDDGPSVDAEEVLKVQLLELKKREAALVRQKAKLDADKGVLVLEVKRVRDEDRTSPRRHEPV